MVDQSGPRPLGPTALMFGNVVTGLAVMSPTGMLADLAQGLSVSIYRAGLLVTIGAFVLCIGAPLSMWLTSRIDRRLLLTGTMIFVALCHAGFMFVSSYAPVLLIRLVMLAVIVLYTPSAAGAAALLVPPERRASTIVYVFVGWSLSFAFGMPLVAFTAAHVGWRETFGVIGVLALLAAAFLAWRLPRGLRGAPVELHTWAALAKNRLILLLLLVTLLQVSGQFSVFTFLGPLMKAFVNAGPELIGGTFAIFGICGLLGNLVTMRVVGPLGAFATSGGLLLFLLGGAMAWIAGAAAGSLAMLLAGNVLWGLAFAAMNSVQQSRLIAAGPALAGASVALNTSVIYVGQAVGSAMGGLFYDAGLLQANGYTALVFVLLALTTVWFTRPRVVA